MGLQTASFRNARSLISVEGPDAQSYLQGQLSQDITTMAEHGVARALLLQPDGKLVAWLRVLRLAENHFALDVEKDIAKLVLQRLQRFKLRTDAEVTIGDLKHETVLFVSQTRQQNTKAFGQAPTVQHTTTVQQADTAQQADIDLSQVGLNDKELEHCLSMLQEGASAHSEGTEAQSELLGTAQTLAVSADGSISVQSQWGQVLVLDRFLAEENSYSTVDYRLDQTGFDAVRIAARVPKNGVELDSSTVPATAPIISSSVSFTKGCYTGQELVARMDSRGNNAPLRLVCFQTKTDVSCKAGDQLTVAAKTGSTTDGPETDAPTAQQTGSSETGPSEMSHESFGTITSVVDLNKHQNLHAFIKAALPKAAFAEPKAVLAEPKAVLAESKAAFAESQAGLAESQAALAESQIGLAVVKRKALQQHHLYIHNTEAYFEIPDELAKEV